jgi:hypothetical protein
MIWNQIIYKFQTAMGIPAPYAHFYTLSLKTTDGKSINAELEITYTGREELDEQEIFDEGFTGDDDVQWKGSLPDVWMDIITQSLKKLPGKLSRIEEENENDDFQELFIETPEKDIVIEHPKDLRHWNYTAQEIIQAIFEAAGREMPFEMDYIHIEAGNTKKLQFNASFLKRQFTMTDLATKKTQNLDWSQLQTFLETIFAADFRPDLISGGQPKQPGHYLRSGDDLWYELGISILDPNGGTKAIKKIERLLGDFL